jgi:N-acetylglucosamine-6-phosphate deacetylase
VIGNDTLAGSTLTLDRALLNFAQFTGASFTDTLTLATRNPARMTGLDDEIGSVAPGRSADLAVLSNRSGIIGTILRGVPQVGPSSSGYLNG